MTTTPRTIHTAETAVPALRDKNGRVRSVATTTGYRKGQKPGNHGMRFVVQRLTTADVDMLISGRSRTSASGLRDRSHISLLYGSGLRIQESLDLVPKDITIENGAHVVLVRCGKGSKMRRVGLLPMAVPHLDAWIDKRRVLGISDDRRLFCTIAQPNMGQPVGSPQVRTMLKRTAGLVGLDKRVNPHVFRHSLAMELAHRGTPLTIISRQLGHSNVGTTGIYLRSLSDDEVFDAMAAIDVAEHRRPMSASGDLADMVRAAAEGSTR